MRQILASHTASISELKKSPSALIEKAGEEVVAILTHNRPSAYLVPSTVYEAMLQELEKYRAVEEVQEYTLAEEAVLEDWDGCDA
jgi:antitoxin StbD